MKKLLQLLSACALLLSSFVFAQTDCLKDLPTDVLIKKKLEQTNLIGHLVEK